MDWFRYRVVAFGLLILGFSCAYMVDDNPYHHFVKLDPEINYRLEWKVNWNLRRVYFNITAQTLGYIGFGLTKHNGKMADADIVIGGVYPSGRPYFSDRHAVANQLPELDSSQDWRLHSATESDGHTFLSFSRGFDTCDERHDVQITDDAINLIWAVGNRDDHIEYHFQRRGSYQAYLLDPDFTPEFLDATFKSLPRGTQVFSINSTLTLPQNETVYWCSFHKTPTTAKHHIIGFDLGLPTESGRRHVREIVLRRCFEPKDANETSVFQVENVESGSQCNFFDGTAVDRFCRETITAFGVGSTVQFLPEHIGIPMSESGTEYFLLQIHYDNQELIENLTITSQLDIYYTSALRRHDAGVLQLGVQTESPLSIVIPPSSKEYVIIGHCAPGCTERMIDTREINVFASLLLTRSAGKAVRFMHHRGDQELSWISNDDNYNPNFQQFRILKQERRFLPGDHIMERCVYDSSTRNGTVVTGGYSSREEMCTGYLYYYPRSKGSFGFCRSELRTESYKNVLGIRNATWDQDTLQSIVTSPPQFTGLTIAEFADTYIHWDLETRRTIQSYHQFHPQVSHCPMLGNVDSPSPNDSNITEHTLPKTILNQNGRFPLAYGRSFSYQRATNQLQTEYVSVLPRGIPRYRSPQRCSTNHRDNLWNPR